MLRRRLQLRHPSDALQRVLGTFSRWSRKTRTSTLRRVRPRPAARHHQMRERHSGWRRRQRRPVGHPLDRRRGHLRRRTLRPSSTRTTTTWSRRHGTKCDLDLCVRDRLLGTAGVSVADDGSQAPFRNIRRDTTSRTTGRWCSRAGTDGSWRCRTPPATCSCATACWQHRDGQRDDRRQLGAAPGTSEERPDLGRERQRRCRLHRDRRCGAVVGDKCRLPRRVRPRPSGTKSRSA